MSALDLLIILAIVLPFGALVSLLATHVLRTLQARAELRRRNHQRAVLRQQIADFTEDCHVEAYRAKASRVLGLVVTVAVGAITAEARVW